MSIERITKSSKKSTIILKPNFLLPGVGRAGSTFLYSCLKQHPEIYLSTIKELRFFSSNYELGKKWYLKHFESKKKFPAVGEASTEYMYSEKGTKKMHDFNPDFKFIFMLRNPVDRAFSNYKREIQVWGESRTFEEILETSDRYTWPGRYFTHMSRYLKYFPKESLKFVVFEKFIKNTHNYLREICEFLNVNAKFKFNSSAFNRNPSKMPINLPLQKFNRKLYYFNPKEHILKQILRIGCGVGVNYINHLYFKSRKFPKMKEPTKTYLKEYFNDEILKLEELIEQDLSIWK